MIAKKVLRELQAAVGRGKVFADKEYLLAYSYDATGHGIPGPTRWCSPEHEGDIAAVLRILPRHGASP